MVIDLKMAEQYFIDEKLLQKKKWGTQQRVGFTLMMIGGIGIAISIIAQIYFAARKRASR